MNVAKNLFAAFALTVILLSPATMSFAFTNGQSASIVIGQPDFATVTPGTVNQPAGVALDSAGNLLVVDAFNHRVLKFLAPLSTGMAASIVIGQPDFATVSSGSGNNKFNQPAGVALDSAGNLWVADDFNHRVLKFTAPLSTGMAASIVVGQPDFATVSPGLSGDNKFNRPVGVALDSAGNLLVADLNNNRVLKFTAPLSTGMAASIVVGQPDFATTFSASGDNKLNLPFGVALDSTGNLLVADFGNQRVMRFAAPLSTGMVATTVIGQPDFATTSSGSGNNKFNQPVGVALDSTGNLLVTDTGNHRVMRFAAPLSTGMVATTVIGQPDFATTSSGSGNNKFNFPKGVALDSVGNLLVTDTGNNRVLRFSAAVSGAQVTGQAEIAGTCGLAIISGSPINYGGLIPSSTSAEQTLVLDNTGSVPSTLFVKGADWVDSTPTTQMLVGNTKFSTASGTYASKTALTTLDQTITAAFSPTTNLNTFWQLQANLISPSFAGSLTQTYDLTSSC